MNKKTLALMIAGTVLLTACVDEKTTDNTNTATAPVSTVSKEDAIAVVNGKYISKASLTALENDIAQRGQGQTFPQDKLLEELVQRELLIQDAVLKKLDTTDEFTNRLETIKSSLLSQAAIQNHLKSNPITDADLEAEYNKNIADAGTEYKARHILLKTEEEAKKIIAELNKGADFAKLAKIKSTGPSGPQGGDLGWFSGGQMVAPFSEAAIALEDGKYTTEPVKTQFGWHIILKEGSRAQTPPPFESVKEQLRPMLQRKKMQTYMESLHQQAKVEILLPAEEEQQKTEPAKAPKQTKAPTGEKPAETPLETSKPASDESKSVSDEAKKSADKVTTDVKTEATKTTEQAKDAAVDNAEKTIETIIEKAKEVANEKASKTSDTATKTLEALKNK
jgi:peptidyl-prolyl cis-trans isomerase C